MKPFQEAPRVFFSQSFSKQEPSACLSLLREAILLLFPRATPLDWLDEKLQNPQSLLLREGENLLWIEMTLSSFSREGISDYLLRARKIETAVSARVHGILLAPHFESGVEELLELIRIPIRLFRFREARALPNPIFESHPHSFPLPTLWIEEWTSASFQKSNPPMPPSGEATLPPFLSKGSSLARNRLSREELREFIQLELDVAFQKYK